MKPASKLTDEELFEELRHQVNAAKNKGGHDRKRTREISEEMGKRLKPTKAKP
jgi:hypothetical protein